MATRFNAIVDYENAYVQQLLLNALKSRIPEPAYSLLEPGAEPDLDQPLLEIRQYEKIDFESATASPSKRLINSYIIRKALIRKHYLSSTIRHWAAKHKDSILTTHWKASIEFELDYAEFLDDALVEAFELHESFKNNEDKHPRDREWWILKPGMSDRGQGIRLFSTYEELESIFQGWEDALPDSDEEDESSGNGDEDGIMTSQLRHFIAQPYIAEPLLLESEGSRKFHVRTYVLAVGALSVYVYKPMLALFAPEPYEHPGKHAVDQAATVDLRSQLTNTCLQGTSIREGSVRLFSELDVSDVCKDRVRQDIFSMTGELFEAAARGMVIDFQPLPNAFEIFGLDFLVDESGKPWLLEVNAFPDFRQTGDSLKGVIQELFEDVADLAIKPFFGMESGPLSDTSRMRKVLDPEVDKIYLR